LDRAGDPQSVDGFCEDTRAKGGDMFKETRAILVSMALMIIAVPVPAQQSAASLPDCSWTTKTRWADGEARLVKPAGSNAGPIVADLIVRYDARKALEENEAAGRQVLLELSRPHATAAFAPTMSFPKSTIRLAIDGVETLRFAADSEGERSVGAAFKNGVTQAKTLEVFSSAGTGGEQRSLIRCTLTQTADAIREMEAEARGFAIKEKFEKLRIERSRKDVDQRVRVCRERAQVGLTRIKWDHQDDVKACNADAACIKTANAKRDASAATKQQELAGCDSLGSK
jgi:hypothetical protein